MLRKLLLTSLVLPLFLGYHIPVVYASESQSPATCTGSFEGTVTHGVDLGLQLTGTITLTVNDNGDISGTLTQNNETTFNVTGKFQERVIKLNIDLGDSEIRGVGQLPSGFTPCTTNFGGHFTGPDPSDIGDWGIVWGS